MLRVASSMLHVVCGMLHVYFNPPLHSVLGKYPYLDVTSGNSPWIANINSSKWFVVCVLEAWYQSGTFKPDLAVTLYETLKSYYETISTGTETTLEVSEVWFFLFLTY